MPLPPFDGVLTQDDGWPSHLRCKLHFTPVERLAGKICRSRGFFRSFVSYVGGYAVAQWHLWEMQL